MERESRETWSKRIERWKDSGLTAKEYAAELGVNAPLAIVVEVAVVDAAEE